MSKPIKLTDEYIQQCKEEFAKELESTKLLDGKLNYTKVFSSNDKKATVVFTPIAWAKMVMVIQDFPKEVAWHGVAKRSEEDSSVFTISDILVFPQEVTGSTVNTDQVEYQNWLLSLDDEQFNNLRMHGHSHVNMGCTPSGTDIEHRKGILDGLDGDIFYIFMIWNKRFENKSVIYDMQENILYEEKDIEILLGENGVDLKEFLGDAHSVVKEKKYQPTTSTGGSKTTQVASGYNYGNYYHTSSGLYDDDEYEVWRNPNKSASWNNREWYE